MKLEDDNYCFVCGKENPVGLRLNFELDRDSRTIKTEFTPSKKYQGYRDLIHGGMVSTVLDEAMVKLAIGLGINVVTASMVIKFRKPLFVGEKIIISAKLYDESKKAIKASARAVKDDDTIVAEAEALLMRIE